MAEDGQGGPGAERPAGQPIAYAAEAVGPTVALSRPAEAGPAAALPPVLGLVLRSTYEFRGEIARGGLGRIVEAHDHRLDRAVAIKELLAEHSEEGSLQARFTREALLTARLQHPAIVPVYEAGHWPDGAPFFTMKLVEGQSLEVAVRERATLEERLGLIPHVIDVANALAYAHGKRIIHRDLKPANVLVGAFGETVVIDWGLAKDLAQGPDAVAGVSSTALPVPVGATQAGSVLGTPAYMPPEQACGDPVDERADVYALGALLYHVLSGGPPYSGKSSAEILLQVAREPPEDVLAKEPGVPPELAAITRRALARQPAARYPTAAELAADLGRYQTGQRVVAHRYPASALVWRFVRRHRAALTVAVGMLALLVAVVVRDFRRIVEERDRAEGERLEAQRLREQADARGDALALREAEALLGKDPRKALAWLKHLAPESRSYGAARILAAEALARGVPTRVLADTAASALAAAPDGKLVALAVADDVLLLDVDSGQRQVLRSRGGPGRALAFAPGGRRLAWAGGDGVVHVFSRGVGATTDLRGHEGEVAALAFAGDDRLVTAGRDGTVRIWPLGQGEAPRVEPLPGGPPLDLATAGELVAVATTDGLVRLFGLADRAGTAPVTLPCALAPTRLLFSTDGAWLVATGDDPRVAVWEVATRHALALEPAAARISAVAPGPGSRFALGDAEGGLRVVELPEGRSLKLAGHAEGVLALAFTADGMLASGGHDHEVRLWDVGSGRLVRTLLGHEGDVLALAAAGRSIVSAGRDRTVRFWDPGAAQPRVALTSERPLFALAASADGQRLAAGGVGTLAIVDAAGKRTLPLRGERVRALAFSPDGALLAAGLESGAVRLFGPDDAARELGRLAGPVQGLAFDLRGRRVAAGGSGGLAVYDVGGGSVFAAAGPIAALAYSPGGTLLATAGADARLWDADTGRPRVLEGGAGPFVTVAVSPDGHHVAAGGRSGVLVWSIASGAARALGTDPVARVAFTSDGKLLVAVAGDRILRVWDVASGVGRLLPVDAGSLLDVGAVRQATAATAGSDGAVRIWDLVSGRSRRAGAHAGAVFGLALTDGGRGLASAGEDGTVRVWPDGLPEDAAALHKYLLQATDAEVGGGL